MRLKPVFIASFLVMSAAGAALAQAPAGGQTGPAQAIDRAGETVATRGAPGTVVPAPPGTGVAPGVQAPAETRVGDPASTSAVPKPASH
ncbi:hypothetical protein [uncultured Methylobacterium sp.]|uniref:hypothetical protein n=1 Tax=uncultured Methylobacterium sp. TaxID=157278 RepID=UPI0035CB758F